MLFGSFSVKLESTMSHVPAQPKNSYRVQLQLTSGVSRMDSVLMQALRAQNDVLELKNISREQFKKLFKDKRVLIKDQVARPSSALASGTTYVDLIGFAAKAK